MISKQATMRIEFPNGDVFQVQAMYVARNRAVQIAMQMLREGTLSNAPSPDNEDFDRVYQKAYDESFHSERVLVDWLHRMNWEEIEQDAYQDAYKVDDAPKPDYARMWSDVEAYVAKPKNESDAASY